MLRNTFSDSDGKTKNALFRVHGLNILRSRKEGLVLAEQWHSVLSRCLNALLVTGASQSLEITSNNRSSTMLSVGSEVYSSPSSSLTHALRVLDVNFNADANTANRFNDKASAAAIADTAVIASLISGPTALLSRPLLVLRITRSRADESADLGTLAALATHLQELSFVDCGITSLCRLHEGRGRGRVGGGTTHLRKMSLVGCEGLISLEGIGEEDSVLEELILSGTPISSLRPLQGCQALVTLDLGFCHALTSLEGLEGLARLEEVDAYQAAIPSLRPLRTCRAIRILNVTGCSRLTSLEGLEGKTSLEFISVSDAPISSLRPLLTCPALKTVYVGGCKKLTSLDGLQDHAHLTEVYASSSAITSLQPLLVGTTPSLAKVSIGGCRRLKAQDGIKALRAQKCSIAL